MTLSSIILTEQFPPGEVGHKEVTHVEDADDDAHGPHGQARINVPENKTKYYKFWWYDTVWRQLKNSHRYIVCLANLLYSLSVRVEELVTLALVSPCQVMMATAPLPMNMKVPMKFQIGWKESHIGS